MNKKSMTRRLLWLAALVAGLLAVSAGPASAQIIWPADGTPTATTARPAPTSLLNLPIDWSALGFTNDSTLYYDDTELADAGPTAAPMADPPGHQTLTVGNNPMTCPQAQYMTIQGAVTAASPGANIIVCPGTYVEQVLIPAGKDDLTLRSQKPLQAIIQAPAVMTTPKAIVEIQAQNVRIRQFAIQGPGGGPCDSLEEGVFVDQGGSATIEHNHIAHIRDNPLSGCQNGLAVLVGRASLSTTGSATVSHNRIDDFQKGGIVVSNSGSDAKVEKNIVQGVGPTALIAANGIQVSSGATARIKDNDVSGNVYTPMTVTSTGILLFQSGATDVENNKVHDNDTGIYAFQTDSSVTVEKNGVLRSTYDGITIDTSDGTQVSHNKTQGNDFGVGVYGTMNATVDDNEAKDNSTNGFYAGSDTSNNTFQNNKAKGSGMFDCRDDSTGTGTAGTANFWLKDKGDTSSPAGICKDG